MNQSDQKLTFLGGFEAVQFDLEFLLNLSCIHFDQFLVFIHKKLKNLGIFNIKSSGSE